MANLINTIRAMKEAKKSNEEKEKIIEEIELLDEAGRFGLTQALIDAVRDVVKHEKDGNDKDEKATVKKEKEKEKDSEKLDKADPKQAKKDFKDRDDKDIDNDGDTDKSDEYLHNKRQAVSKAMDAEKKPSDGYKPASNKDKDEKSPEEKKKEKEYAAKKEKGQEKVSTSPTVSEEAELEEGTPARYELIKKAAKKINRQDAKAARDAARGIKKDKDLKKRKNDPADMDESYIAEDAASELKAYGTSKGGVDKQDFMAIANMISKKKSVKQIGQMIALLDTDPRDKIISIINKADKKMGAELMKGYKKLREEVEEVEEAVGSAAKYADKKGMFGGKYTHHDRAVTMKGDKFDKWRDKQSKKRSDAHKAQDPKMAKRGYAQNIVDTGKAQSKAAKKGLGKQNISWQQKNSVKRGKLPESVELDEAGNPARYDMIKKAAQKIDRQDSKAARAAAKSDMKKPGATKGMATTKKEDNDPCWKDYEMVGMKDKNGKKVPNCVPKEEKETNEGMYAAAQNMMVSKMSDSSLYTLAKKGGAHAMAAKRELQRRGKLKNENVLNKSFKDLRK